MKFVIKITEVFDKLITVEANSEKEAVKKCWDNFINSNDDTNPVFIDYYDTDSEIDYSIADTEDVQMVLDHEDYYDYLK